MKWFDYQAPRHIDEAVRLLTGGATAVLLAGGTDLLVQMRSGRKAADVVVDVKHIPELTSIEYGDGGLELGAATPCYRIYGDDSIRRHYPSLAEVAGIIGGTQIQGRASIGGNLCNASPSADSIPLLIALKATARIAGPGGERSVPVEDFCVAPGKNVLGQGEMLVSLRIPKPEARSGACYIRFIPRNEMDIAVVGAGVSVILDNGHIREARVALSAVAPTPLFVRKAGESLSGQPVHELEAASLAARDAVAPITDMRGPAEYRRHLSGVLTRRALEAAITRAQTLL